MIQNHLGKTLLAISAVLSSFILLPAQRGTIVNPSQLVPLTQHTPSGKTVLQTHGKAADDVGLARTTTVNPIAIGRMPNIYSSTESKNNCVYAHDSSGTVMFIHRNDPGVFGGSSFGLRYDISIDRGATWNSDIGPINPANLSGRYPQLAGYEPVGSTSPLAGRAIFLSEHYVPSVWTGFNAGSSDRVTSGSPASQDVIVNTTEQSQSGGMTEGLPGEYWAARFTSTTGVITDSLKIYKGVYNTGTQSIAWAFHAAKVMPWSLSFDGEPHAFSPSVAFSPDGNIGWIATLGDLATATDSTFFPILMKSTDGGATWGNPFEVDINGFPWVYDSLRALWVDSLGDPASSGRATAGFDYDLTVDAYGNPHLFFVIGTGHSPSGNVPYSIYAGLAKYAVDLSSFDQGTHFDLRLIAPILTFRGEYFGTTNFFSQDNYPQISRTDDGQYIFYSWTDSDTMVIGYGEFANLAPNLYLAGLRLQDGYFTCIIPVTAFDLIWDGRVLSPQMAPEVMVAGSGPSTTYNLPIVVAENYFNDVDQPFLNHYFGNDAVITESQFAYPPGSTVTWLGCGVSPGIAAHLRGKVFIDYNGNGVFDGTDTGVPNQMVTTSGITYADLTYANGDFNIACAPNFTYGLNTTMNPAVWTPSIPTVPYSLAPGPLANLTGNDFGFQPVTNAQDLAVAVVIGPMRPGFTTSGTIYVSNLGTVPSTGTLTLTYDTLATLNTSTPAATTNNPTLHQATWTLPTIPVFGSAVIHVGLYIPPTVPLNSSLSFGAHVATTGADVDGYNNTDAINVLVIGSYDPNDKAVAPAGLGSNHQVTPGAELSYRIRCQNTGTASAINVVVRDTLDTDLDIATFKMLGASHPYVLTIDNGRFLTWDFSNINLPDSFSNEPASHAYIDFSISPKANRPLGTVVENSAAIYFDFNAPVITNTTWISYDITIATTPTISYRSVIHVYPHPVCRNATVEFLRYGDKSWSFELLDLQGRRVFHEATITTDLYAFDRGALPAGTYVYRVTAQGILPKFGKLVLQ